MTKDVATLNAVALARRDQRDSKAQLLIEAANWVEQRMAEKEVAVEKAVLAALEDGHKVTAVAQAYTLSGKTPDRNAIYTIRKKHANIERDIWTGEYPFEWVARDVQTAKGVRVVYDIHTSMAGFGPEEVTGDFTWRYDTATDEVEEILDFDGEPYPTTKYYKQVFDRWLRTNPYPGED